MFLDMHMPEIFKFCEPGNISPPAGLHGVFSK